ncbi:hypothetical protein C0585_07290 [Candidatus Woesearchaeota archaeon]|nr:MAG: hypothetical protein C0585_07290 [Candidatus Woesearchaeota archaeon]
MLNKVLFLIMLYSSVVLADVQLSESDLRHLTRLENKLEKLIEELKSNKDSKELKKKISDIESEIISTKNIIEPFGNLQWDMSLTNAFAEICKMESVDKVTFVKYYTNTSKIEYPQKNLCEEEVSSIISRTYDLDKLSKQATNKFEEKFRLKNVNSFNNILKSTININSKNYIVDDSLINISIVAETVTINGLHYRLVVTFNLDKNNAAGMYFDKKKPEKFIFNSEEYNVHLHMHRIELIPFKTKEYHNLISIKLPDITDTLAKKYSNFKKSFYGRRELRIYGARFSQIIVFETGEISYSYPHLVQYEDSFKKLMNLISTQDEGQLNKL